MNVWKNEMSTQKCIYIWSQHPYTLSPKAESTPVSINRRKAGKMVYPYKENGVEWSLYTSYNVDGLREHAEFMKLVTNTTSCVVCLSEMFRTWKSIETEHSWGYLQPEARD